jgi:hypothetical protein
VEFVYVIPPVLVTVCQVCPTPIGFNAVVAVVAKVAVAEFPEQANAFVAVAAVVALVAFVALVALVALVAVAALPPIESPEAVPVMFVPTKAEGVPNAGVTSVGELLNTTLPVPVEVVTPVPPFNTGKVPVTPVVKGKPVALVRTPDVGVPNAGVTSVGLVARTTEPVPVAVVTPVPPDVTGRAFKNTASVAASSGVTSDDEYTLALTILTPSL